MEIVKPGARLARRALMFGGAAAGGLIAAAGSARADASPSWGSGLPVGAMEAILQASGTVTNGVLSVEIDRNDLMSSLPGNIPILPANQLNGTFTFQSIEGNSDDGGLAILNGDFCLKPAELNPFIDALIANGLVVQAFHQHLFNLSPLYFFIHFRGIGNPLALARAARNAVGVTSTPLPQPPPSGQTPFDAKRLGDIVGGMAMVGGSGVVNVSVPRRERVRLGGVYIKPELNISTVVAFQPLDSSGSRAVVIPDFALIGREVDPVFKEMRGQGWTIGCLYNQETDEYPQLYFSHQYSVGDPYALAAQVRNGLDLTNSVLTS